MRIDRLLIAEALLYATKAAHWVTLVDPDTGMPGSEPCQQVAPKLLSPSHTDS